MDLEKIGNFIRQQREKLKLTQEELGNKMHVSRQAVSFWENGKTLPESEVLLDLSELFQVSINEILGAKDVKEMTVQLVDDNHKKTSKIKRLIWLINILLITTILLFLLIYFFYNYNSIKIYKITGTSTNYKVIEGLGVFTIKDSYFKLGELKTNNEDNSIEKITLYYKDKNKKKILFETNKVEYISIEKYEYDELSTRNIKNLKDHFYLEIKMSNKEKEVMKLEFREYYTNDLRIILESSNITKIKELENTVTSISNISSKETKEEKVVEEPVLKEENLIEEINYENIISTIKTNGIEEEGIIHLEKELTEDENISYSLFMDRLTITHVKDNNIEEWSFQIDKYNRITYHNYDENNLVDKRIKIESLTEEEQVIYNQMLEYLKLIN